MVDDPKKNETEEKPEHPSPEAGDTSADAHDEGWEDSGGGGEAPDREQGASEGGVGGEPPDEDEPREGKKRVALYLAQYDTSAKVLHAAEKVRKAGYTVWDTHTPFPVHGMDRAMGLPDSRVGWIVFFSGLAGVSGAYLMMWWMGGVDYPLVVGGKPGFTLPSSVPIMFELMVLLSSFGAILGMLHLNKLPRHHHPVFESERFRAATDDQFFLSIEAEDPKFHVDETKAVLEGTHPVALELVEELLEEEDAASSLKKEAH